MTAALLRLVAGRAPLGFAVCGPRGELLAMNRTLAELFGVTTGEVAAIHALGRTPEARAALATALSMRTLDATAWRWKMLHEGSSGAPEELALTDGRVLERSCIASAGPATIAAFYRDVSLRRRNHAELAARASQQAALAVLGELAMSAEEVEPLLHAACASIAEVLEADAAAVWDQPEGRVTIVAGAGIQKGPLDGASPAAALGFRTAAEVALFGCERRVLGAYARDERAFSADEVRFLETAASLLSTALARRRAEEEVIDREREGRAVFEAALDAMLVFDDDGVIRDANAAAGTLLGTTPAALVGRSIDTLVPVAHDRLPAGPGGPSPLREAQVTGPDGRAHPVELAVLAAIHPGRQLAVMRDIAERKRLHARLAFEDRLVSTGTLAAGVAHELNNPLAYVNANVAFLAERLERVRELLARTPGLSPEDADLTVQLAEAARDARAGAERMRGVIRDLETFSRASDEPSGAVDLRPVIECCVKRAWTEIGHRARLVKDLPELPPVRGDEARLKQVFLNVLVNAAQAIREGGVAENEIAIRARRDGARVVVEIRDTGCGIAPEHLQRVFDPFFTTKAPGAGIGLGLSICHHIVTGLGGEISVEPAARGTLVRVALPAAERAGRSAAPPAPAPPPAGRGPRRLGDAEPLVGTGLARALRGEHDVTFVSSARAALERIEGGAPFDLVLTDLLMPGMSGVDLYRALGRRDPRLARRVIFLTGGAFTPAARAFLATEPVPCVEKPFELDAIRGVLARRLAELSAA
ncbi:hybrid sensor histidine kinase/response regulator [Anaeromyxobacter oryzisoli]|uniref:hybrid sensor histidine kinase/response regulator n=1 Tax=Anaeromyxobacter oryzisoli TaxID=2925408 RepID=UPI001F57ECBA|nr:hybrid sensor histidine kinase/response regulator [Anaeromyxobacter sp. SG63]